MPQRHNPERKVKAFVDNDAERFLHIAQAYTAFGVIATLSRAYTTFNAKYLESRPLLCHLPPVARKRAPPSPGQVTREPLSAPSFAHARGRLPESAPAQAAGRLPGSRSKATLSEPLPRRPLQRLWKPPPP